MEDTTTRFADITRDTIKAGIERILSGSVGVRKDLIAQIATGWALSDGAEIDAEGADANGSDRPAWGDRLWLTIHLARGWPRAASTT